jgi:hypothetical protein
MSGVMEIKTFEEYLLDQGKLIEAKIQELLVEYSSLEYYNPSGDGVVFISATGYHFWRQLPLKGKRLQSELLQEYEKFRAILSILFRAVSTKDVGSFDESEKVIKNNIMQSGPTWSKTPKEALDEVDGAFKQIQKLLEGLHSSKEGCLFVPDTNALLMNPDISLWRFDSIAKFTLVLTPTVLAELDSLKMNHRNQDVREKSEKIIRQIKEYRRRGNIVNGVPVVKDLIRIQSIAIEPNFSNSLPWLDPTNKDDRLLLSVYEIIASNIRSTVYLVTADINLQNKAEFAFLPYCEPPR